MTARDGAMLRTALERSGLPSTIAATYLERMLEPGEFDSGAELVPRRGPFTEAIRRRRRCGGTDALPVEHRRSRTRTHGGRADRPPRRRRLQLRRPRRSIALDPRPLPMPSPT